MSELGNISFVPGSPILGVQKKCYDCLIQAVFPNTIFDTIYNRIEDMFAPFDTSGIEIPAALGVLAMMRKHDATRVFKTWVHSWATSYRMHEHVLLPCLSGCPGQPDRLAHYLMCPMLYALQVLIPDTPPP